MKTIRDMIVLDALSRGLTVIVDDTNLSHPAALLDIANTTGVKFAYVDFPTPIEECHRRNELRTGVDRVPRRVIDNMHWKAFRLGIYPSTTDIEG